MQLEDSFRLLHFLTGKYLKAFESVSTRKTTLGLTSERNSYTVFQFELVTRGYSREVIANTTHFKKDCLIYLKSVHLDSYVTCFR